jgi:DNA polymerase III alpha subunit
VLHQMCGGIVDERWCLLLWASMLKERTTTERARAEARQQHLDMRVELLNMLQTTINSCYRDSQRMLAEAKELYASAKARANNTIKQAEELVVCVRVIEEQEHAVDELEQKLQEWEALDNLRLERELAGLATRESSVERCEAALVAEQRDFEDTRASVLAHELAADTRECAMETRAMVVVDRERLLAEQQMQELVVAQKWL